MKAKAAGATPNEIYTRYKAWDHAKAQTMYLSITTYHIGQTIELLSEQAAAVSPSCDSTVHEVKEKSKRHEAHGSVKVFWVIGHQVTHIGKYRHGTAYSIQQGDQVSKLEITDHREVSSRVDQILISLWDCFACGFCFLGHCVSKWSKE